MAGAAARKEQVVQGKMEMPLGRVAGAAALLRNMVMGTAAAAWLLLLVHLTPVSSSLSIRYRAWGRDQYQLRVRV